LTIGATGMNLGTSNPDVIAKKGSGKAGLQSLEKAGIGSGALAPYEIVAPAGDAPKVVAALSRLDGIHGAVAPGGPAWSRSGTRIVDAFSIPNPATGEARALVGDVRSTAHDAGPGVRVS